MTMQKTSEVYKKLYHYTNWDGLHGILKNQSLWATHCKFLNDYSEISLFKPNLIKFLRPYFAGVITDNGSLDTFAEHYVEALYDLLGHELYIASFCSEHNKEKEENEYVNNNGLLSQWRGYGKDGGFALVFSAQELDKILRLEADRFNTYSILSHIIYSDDDEKFKSELSAPMHKIAKYILEAFRLNMEQIKKGTPIAENPPDFIQHTQEAFPDFVKCVSRYKHRGFKEENEVRIVVWPMPLSSPDKQDKERKLRGKNGRVIPYIELFSSEDIKLSIERIIVGPHKEKEARASALRIMLRNTGIDVTVSDIRYISS